MTNTSNFNTPSPANIIVDDNLFGQVIDAFLRALDKNGNHLAMDSIIISQGNKAWSHTFTQGNPLFDLRSLSKPILGAAVGVAMERGFTVRDQALSLDMDIWPFFEHRVHLTNQLNRHRLKKIKLRHLLNHTMGFSVGLMFSKDIKERPADTLLEYIFNSNLDYDPGVHFVYSNVGPYVISALIQEENGISLDKWVGDMLLNQLGISNYEWKRYGPYCAGCSGLKLSNADLHKVARLFADDGVFHGKQIVPGNWVAQMHEKHVLTPSMYDDKRVFPKYAYGYYLWICKDGRYYCDGTDGQYLVVLPESGIAITTSGHQPDMKPITECMRLLLG